MTVRRMSAQRPKKGNGSASVHGSKSDESQANRDALSAPKAEVVSSNLAGCANSSLPCGSRSVLVIDWSPGNH